MTQLLTSAPLMNGNAAGSQARVADDTELLDQLAKKWCSHRARGLKLRWDSGALLNRTSLGDPAKRSAYGKGILKEAAKRLEISRPDLGRMRWFARLFESFADFEKQHPGIGTWTQVKAPLPSLIAAFRGNEDEAPATDDAVEQPPAVNGDGPKPSGDAKKNAALVVGVLRSVRSATKRFHQGFALNEATKKQMRESLQQLNEVASGLLGIRVSIEIVEGA